LNVPTQGSSLHVMVEKGKARVLARADLLEAFALCCGQPGAMSWLRHFLSVPSFRGKMPYVVLVVSGEARAEALTAKDLRGAVLLFEYRLMGLPTGLFCTDDWSGFRTVLSRDSERHVVAGLAADSLLQCGGQYILLSYDGAGRELTMLPLRNARMAEWAQRTRPVATVFPLESTLEKTLAKLGKSTRFNLGYYRRRLAVEMPCEFLEDARGMVREDELDGLNQGSLNVISNEEFRLQYKSACALPGGFLLGLRARDGRWISLIGGWKQGKVTVLQWQMNAAGYERLSIGTAMRSYYLEHECKQGTETLVFYGGTPHLMHRSFLEDRAQDLFVRRRSLRAKALMWLAKFLQARRGGRQWNSQLAQAMTREDWVWQRAQVGVLPAHAMKGCEEL
jgi:hypothetical protein